MVAPGGRKRRDAVSPARPVPDMAVRMSWMDRKDRMDGMDRKDPMGHTDAVSRLQGAGAFMPARHPGCVVHSVFASDCGCCE